MADYTTNYSLSKPDYGDPVNVGSDIVANFQKIDNYVGAPVGNASEFDEAPKGQLYWDENAGRLYLKRANDVIPISRSGTPRGKVAYQEFTTTGPNFVNFAEIVSGLQLTFTAQAGRRYLIYDFHTIQWVSGGPTLGAPIVICHYRWAPGASITTSSTQIASCTNNMPGVRGNDKGFTRYLEFFPNIDGQVTFGITLENRSTDQVTRVYHELYGRNGIMWAKDYG